MGRGFAGEVAEFYHRYRHGYPAAVLDALTKAFELTGEDVAVDLGCGTGQLTLPLAGRVRAVAGVDPEPDMLRRAGQAARDRGVTNVTWILGTDADLPAIGRLAGTAAVGLLTIGQALHWMSSAEVFRAAGPLLRPGGGVAVVTNGTPLWLQPDGWSRALREFLQRWLGETLSEACGTDEESQRRYRDELGQAGFEVTSTAVDYLAELSLDEVIGGVYSAFPVDRLPPPEQRPDFAAQVREALGPADRFAEQVHVAVLLGRKRKTSPALLS
jgi:SAM-dependent methyltransferase